MSEEKDVSKDKDSKAATKEATHQSEGDAEKAYAISHPDEVAPEPLPTDALTPEETAKKRAEYEATLPHTEPAGKPDQTTSDKG